jgi:hypothetical protein
MSSISSAGTPTADRGLGERWDGPAPRRPQDALGATCPLGIVASLPVLYLAMLGGRA